MIWISLEKFTRAFDDVCCSFALILEASRFEPVKQFPEDFVCDSISIDLIFTSDGGCLVGEGDFTAL